MRLSLSLALILIAGSAAAQNTGFNLNDAGYFELEGLDVMAFDDFYPEGHQGGVTIIQHDVRIAANGDLRLEPTPGQWSPVPRQDRREVDTTANAITTWLSYPDPSKDRRGFNPIIYPDLEFSYRIRVEGGDDGVRVVVDLAEPLPDEWIGKVGFNLELFPAALFGTSWYMDGASGIFPRQGMGPVTRDEAGAMQPIPLATGRRLTIAPEEPALQLIIETEPGDLQLYDQRMQHNNGWFIVRSTVPAGATDSAVVWKIKPNVIPGWRRTPTIQVSQVGYHTKQKKVAVIELDDRDDGGAQVELRRVSEEGGFETVMAAEPPIWGRFLRYNYIRFDFSEVRRPGMYVVSYRGLHGHPFKIGPDVFDSHVWQPTLEYFLPVQMCHMRVEQQYRVWHGACHLDDARMAPTDHNHFDGYVQGESTLTDHDSGETVPHLNRGGWHDAGDDDLRIESQAEEVLILASAYELFGIDYDETTVDQDRRLTRIHQPDGKPDLLQQVEHGILTILGGYRGLGRLYRGIIVPTLPQYVMIGDWSNQTDNESRPGAVVPNSFRDRVLPGQEPFVEYAPGFSPDDRWVFTEQHAGHEYKGIAALAIGGRVLRDYDPELSAESIAAAEALYGEVRNPDDAFASWLSATGELFLTTRDDRYRDVILSRADSILERVDEVGWIAARFVHELDDPGFTSALRDAVAVHFAEVERRQKANPYGVPYRPHIWGAGWGIQRFGVEQYFLHRAFPEVVSPDYMLNAMNFVLGVHPGSNTKSFASGVGANSMTTAYGFNRADWSYIPGGVVSGTALIRPDFPELKNFPYLWQQGEYVMGGGATHFMFLVMAAQEAL